MSVHVAERGSPYAPASDAPRREPLSSRASTWAWGAVIVLSLLGVVSGIARGVFVEDLVTRVDPVRDELHRLLGFTDPLAAGREALLAEVDGRFARHTGATRLHVLAGAWFLLLAPLQLSRRIRSRYVAFHRWSGRVLVVTALGSAIPGLYFGLVIPFAGTGERSAIAVFGGLFVFALLSGWAAIRRRDVARHREWMIRGFAAALAISTVRLYALVLDLTLTPFAFTPTGIFALSLWLGWGTTVGGAELWIRRTATPGNTGSLR